MTTPSSIQSVGLSINVYKPTIGAGTYTPNGTLVLSGLQDEVDAYQHTIAALGGYESASFSINDRLDKLEDWLDRLGYHVEVYSPDLVLIWEGFINRISLNLGGLAVVRGNLTDIGNRVECIYSTVDTTTTPPTVGMRARTDTVNDPTSQGRYGIIQKILSVGGATQVTAEQIRDTWLNENAEPETSQSYSSGGGQTNVTVDCVGYYKFLDLYAYNQTANTGTLNVSTAIQNAIAANLNALFSTDYTLITANTLQTQRYVNDDDTAWGYIKYLTSQGDASDNRYLFGIYAGRRAVYEVQPTDTAYLQRITDNRQDVETPTGQIVKPWDVLPGRWLLYPDFLVGRITPANKRDDSRYEFIERVTYTAPWALSHTGSKVSTLPQKLAKLGLGGTGA
jgi:hypothetical protein